MIAKIRNSLYIAGLATLVLIILEASGLIAWPWHVIYSPIFLTTYWLLVCFLFTDEGGGSAPPSGT